MTKPKKKYIKVIGIVLLIIIILIILYAHYIGPKGLIVNEFKLVTDQLSQDYDGLKIVQFSDIQYGHTVDSSRLEEIVDNINKQAPDIIIFNGDLVNDDIKLTEKEINKIIEVLNKLSARIEILAVKGDQDNNSIYWSKIVPFLNWIDITNNYETIYLDQDKPLVVIGLDDEINSVPNYEQAFSFMDNSNELYTIVVVHEPDQVKKFENYNFNLILAGHTMGGLVKIPFIGPMINKQGGIIYSDSEYRIKEQPLIINNGIGTTKFEFRLFNHPSINLFRLYTK